MQENKVRMGQRCSGCGPASSVTWKTDAVGSVMPPCVFYTVLLFHRDITPEQFCCHGVIFFSHWQQSIWHRYTSLSFSMPNHFHVHFCFSISVWLSDGYKRNNILLKHLVGTKAGAEFKLNGNLQLLMHSDNLQSFSVQIRRNQKYAFWSTAEKHRVCFLLLSIENRWAVFHWLHLSCM